MARGPGDREHDRRRDLRVWASNRLILDRACAVGQALSGAGIQAMAIKGVAIIGQYPSAAGRPVGDVDILVAAHEVEPALTALGGLGHHGVHPVTPLALTYRHALAAPAGDGVVVDLHWRASTGLPNVPGAPWPSPRAVEPPVGHPLAGSGLVIPSPADQLAITAVHGCRPANASVVHLADDARVLAGRLTDDDWLAVGMSLHEVGHRHRGFGWLDHIGVVTDQQVAAWTDRRGRRSEAMAARLEALAAAGGRRQTAARWRQLVSVGAAEAAQQVAQPWRWPRRVVGRARWELSADMAQAQQALDDFHNRKAPVTG